MRHRMNHAVLSMEPSGIRRVTEMARSIEGCISLALGEPGFDTPSPIREATKAALDAGKTHYPPNAGISALRQEIAAYESSRSDAPVLPENVLITCGSTEAIGCAIFSVLEPGDEIIIPTPAFGLYAMQVQVARGVCVPLQTAENGFQIDRDALFAHITPRTKAILLNSPNNPTGTVYSQASIQAVTQACMERDLFLIYDAVYDRLVYDTALPSPSSARLGARLIRCNAFSKPYAMTGWRVGYCLAEEAILSQLVKVHAALTVGVSTFSQVGCQGIFAVPIEGMLREYRTHRDIVCEALLSMGMKAEKPSGAFYAFPSIQRFGLGDDVFVERLMRERRVAVVPGRCFGAPGFVRISYCCTRENLEQGLQRLAAFVKGL